MRFGRSLVVSSAALAAFSLGLLGGIALAKKSKQPIDPALYRGAEPEAAATALLKHARFLAEDGSWENIAVGRVYYLGGKREEGEAILAKYRDAAKPEASDLVRIARVYDEADEWEKARALFERVVALAPEDTDWIAEFGARANLRGDRARAEDLFDRAFALDSRRLGATLDAAGSYLGVGPE